MEDHPQRDYAAAKHDNDYLIHRVVWTTIGRLESNKSYVLLVHNFVNSRFWRHVPLNRQRKINGCRNHASRA